MIISGNYPAGYTLAAGGYLSITTTGVIGGTGLIVGMGATVVSRGTIASEPGVLRPNTVGGTGATGVQLTNADVMTNYGSIRGGSGGVSGTEGGLGGGGVDVTLGILTNKGAITGGVGGLGFTFVGKGVVGGVGGHGGAGAVVDLASLANDAVISGGAGGIGYAGGGLGGTGVEVTLGVLINSGAINGGDGGKGYGANRFGGDGGSGVLLAGAGTLVNSGTIRGGAGAAAAVADNDGGGGSGVYLALGGVVDNLGAIIGGPGISQSGRDTYGIRLSEGGVVTNGNSSHRSALIDGGVYVTNMPVATRVTNYGTIEGNFGAVRFNSASDTLVEESSGVLVGGIYGGGGKLELGAATGAGTIRDLGGDITGFKTVTVDAGAGWTFSGRNTIVAGETLSNNAAISVDGTLTNKGVIRAWALINLTTGSELYNAIGGVANFTGDTVEGAGRVFTKGASILASVTLGGTAEWINAGTLEAAGKVTIGDAVGDKAEFVNEAGGVFDITGDTSISVGTAATSRFVNAGLIEKTGEASSTSVAVNVLNSGTIKVASGTLDLTGAITGAGSLGIGARTTLEIAYIVAAGQTARLAGGVLQLDTNTGFAGKVSGFAVGDTIDLRGVHFAAGETVRYSGTSSSGVLTVTSGSQSAKVQLLGQYAAGNFAASSDGHGGTDITFAATPAVAPGLATPGR